MQVPDRTVSGSEAKEMERNWDGKKQTSQTILLAEENSYTSSEHALRGNDYLQQGMSTLHKAAFVLPSADLELQPHEPPTAELVRSPPSHY